MTNEQKAIVSQMMFEGKSKKAISTETGISFNTIKSFCRRHLNGGNRVCLQCGRIFTQTFGKRRKWFCSDRCRFMWWSSHPESREGNYLHTCKQCGKEFKNSRKKAVYCFRLCFAKARAKEKNRVQLSDR